MCLFEGWWKGKVSPKASPSEHYHFEGKLYVLVDGGTLSGADDYADLHGPESARATLKSF